MDININGLLSYANDININGLISNSTNDEVLKSYDSLFLSASHSIEEIKKMTSEVIDILKDISSIDVDSLASELESI